MKKIQNLERSIIFSLLIFELHLFSVEDLHQIGDTDADMKLNLFCNRSMIIGFIYIRRMVTTLF
jgi:hypothetical protein